MAKGHTNMTYADVIAELRDYDIKIHRKSLGSYSYEYTVNFHGGCEDTAYYTEDMIDAYLTGKAMATQCGVGDSHKDD